MPPRLPKSRVVLASYLITTGISGLILLIKGQQLTSFIFPLLVWFISLLILHIGIYLVLTHNINTAQKHDKEDTPYNNRRGGGKV